MPLHLWPSSELAAVDGLRLLQISETLLHNNINAYLSKMVSSYVLDNF